VSWQDDSGVSALALLYTSPRQYANAEPLYNRSLSVYEKALGPDDLSVAKTASSLALLYVSQGQYGQAEPLYKRSLAINEKVHGPSHPDVAFIFGRTPRPLSASAATC